MTNHICSVCGKNMKPNYPWVELCKECLDARFDQVLKEKRINDNNSNLKQGDLVLCGCCNHNKVPYDPIYPPDEQLCEECSHDIEELRNDGLLG